MGKSGKKAACTSINWKIIFAFCSTEHASPKAFLHLSPLLLEGQKRRFSNAETGKFSILSYVIFAASTNFLLDVLRTSSP